MAKILLLTQYFPPDITAAAFRLGAFREALENAGHEVVVLTSYPYKGTARSERWEEKGVSRVEVGKAGTGVGDRLFEHLRFACRALLRYSSWYLRSRRESRFDFVVASSPPLSVAAVGLVIKVLARATYIVDIRDIWPESVTATGFLASNSPPITMARFLERYIYRCADFITCVSRGISDHIIRSEASSQGRIRVVYNGVDEEVIRRSSVTGKREPVRGRMSVVYAGNLGIAQNLGIVLEAAARLDADVRENLKVRLIGAGASRERLLRLAQELDVRDVVSFEGPYKRDELAELLASQADALLIHLRQNGVFARTIPSKAFEYLLYNVPIVYGLSGEAAVLLESVGGNIRFEQDSAASLRAALAELVHRYDELREVSSGHRQFVLQHYHRRETVRPLISLIGCQRQAHHGP